MAFDPNAAAARYIDSLGPAALQKAHDYTVGKEWMLLWALLVAAVVTWLIVRSGVLDRLDGKFAEHRRNLKAFVIGLVYFLVSTVLALPWTLYADYFREKSYGRTSQPFGDYLGQLGLITVITALFGAIFMMGVYWLIRRTGKRWWIWSGALTAVAFSFVLLLTPILIEPLFNKYEPVPPGQVRDAVVSMAQRAGIPPNKVYMFNGSRQSNNFTANAGGVGSTARVAISDVAFKNATLDEVRRVELDFPVDVAPVGGQRRERPIPLVLQRFASLQLRGVHFLRSEHFEVSDDSLLVEAVQQTAKRVRCQSTTASGG